MARPDLRAMARALGDDLRVIAAQVGRQDLLFVAGALAYAVLLAALPFAVLLVSAAAFLLGGPNGASEAAVLGVLGQLVPPETAATLLPLFDALLADAIATRGAVGAASALLFAVFSTRLFGALRSAMVVVFETEVGRGLLVGKLFDLVYVAAGTVLVVVYLLLTLLVAALGETGAAVLQAAGASADVVGGLPRVLARATLLGFVAFMFAALYKFLPVRRPRWASAWWGGLWGALLFEGLRTLVFGAVFRAVGPSTLYSGAVAVIVVVVLWVYYASIVFLVGGALARAHEQRVLPPPAR
jgi:membrane protein